MKCLRPYLIIATILILVFGFGADSPFLKEKYHRFVMENGMTVVLEENRNAPVVSIQILIKVGSGDEKDDEAGICHFIEHMLFKGTEKRKVREMAREIESLGGRINAYTSYDQTVYYITIASRYGDIALDFLADAIQHSIFDPVELEREREVILEEIRMGEDDPNGRIFRQTMATVYQRHPYRRPIIGYENTIRSITREQIISFYKRWYVPNRMVFIAVGDIDLKEMENKVREAFKGFRPSTEEIPKRVNEPELEEIKSIISFGNFKETYLHIAFPITSAMDEDTPALDALSHILGGGEASRLVQKVKLEKALVNTISASSFTPKDPGVFIIEATLPPDNMERAFESILEEIYRISQEGPTSEELHRVKVNVASSLIYDRQTVQGKARKIGFYELIAGDIQFEKEYMRRISLLEPEDLNRVVKKYFHKNRLIISILGPSEKAELLKKISFNSIIEGLRFSERSAKEKEEIYKTVLDNGIRLIIKENHSNPIVTIQASFLGGVRFEREDQNGINQFLALMITKGTKRQDSLEIAKKIERMAGSISGFSGYNSFGLTLTCLSQHFEEAFSLFTEIIKEPSFDPQEIEKRRRSILSALRQQEDDLDRMVFKLFRKTIFEKHPYRMDPLGEIDSVKRITREDLNEYYKKIAVPENMVIAVVGDIDRENVILSVKKEFGGLIKSNFTQPDIQMDSPPEKIKRKELFQKKEQAHFVLGFLGISFHDRDRYAIEVLDAALSGQGGRLFYELRDRESFAYALDFMAHTNLDPGYISVYMATHPKKLDKAIEGVLRELRKVKEEGLSEDEIERAKRYLIGNFEIGLQTNAAWANQLSLDELYGLGFDNYKDYPKKIQTVTKEDVNRVVKKYFNLNAYAIAIIRPPDE